MISKANNRLRIKQLDVPFLKEMGKMHILRSKKELEVDQFIPEALGEIKDNLYTSCQSCNRKLKDNFDAKLKSATKLPSIIY